MELKPTVALHGLAIFFSGVGVGIIRANTSEIHATTGTIYIILGIVIAIFTTYSIMNKLKTKKHERRYK